MGRILYLMAEKKDLTPCCQTRQLIEQFAKFIFILINK